MSKSEKGKFHVEIVRMQSKKGLYNNSNLNYYRNEKLFDHNKQK